jgi:dehydrogenase/reductase SDR family member 12
VARITETLVVPTTPERAFAFVADFTTTASWDPGIRAARRLDEGALGVGSRFRVELALGPVSAPLTYEITTFEEPTRVVLTTRGTVHQGQDDVAFRPHEEGTEIVWDATFGVRGPLGRVLDPVLAAGFRRAGREAVSGLAAALGGRVTST